MVGTTVDADDDVISGTEGMDGGGEVLGALDGGAVERHDHVVDMERRLSGPGLPDSTEMIRAPDDGVRWSAAAGPA